MPVGPDDDNGEFHKAGDYCRNGGASDTQGGTAENAKNQYVVQNKIRGDCGNTGQHGNKGLPGFTDSTDVSLTQRKGEQANQHDCQIFLSIFQGESDIAHASGVI